MERGKATCRSHHTSFSPVKKENKLNAQLRPCCPKRVHVIPGETKNTPCRMHLTKGVKVNNQMKVQRLM